LRPEGTQGQSDISAEQRRTHEQSGIDVMQMQIPNSCRNVRLYAQIYDEGQRVHLRALYPEAGPSVPRLMGIENVTTSKLNRSRVEPFRWKATTLIYHDLDAQRCARLLQVELKTSVGAIDIQPLPNSLTSQVGVIELWWVGRPATKSLGDAPQAK
jgi:hypothetical protein